VQTDQVPATPNTRCRALSPLLRSSLVRYLVVGLTSFAVDAGILITLREGADAPLLLAATVSFWTALLFNFTLNRVWSFSGRDTVKVSFAKYLALVGANYVATLGILAVGTRLGVHYVVVKALATATTVCWNYLAYRYWVFR